MAKTEKGIEQYEHKGKKRLNNPPVGLVDPENDKDTGKKTYSYDPHIDPALQFDCRRSDIEKIIDNGLASDDPADAVKALKELKKRQEPYLNWAGKAERTSFDIDTVSLHVHERIDPKTIIDSVRKRADSPEPHQFSFFESHNENPPIREAIEFYKHKHNWSNRMVAGDSLLVMNSLLEKEGLGGQVQMIYIDPPYGIKYGSNFQPFVNKRDVKDGKDEDLTQEPEMIKAFRDTWELGIHSYLSYLRDRLLLARELLTESGSVFVQISDDNVHLVRNLLDEIFGPENFRALITFYKTTGQTSSLLASTTDYLLWYGKDKEKTKYRQVFLPKSLETDAAGVYSWIQLDDGNRRRMDSAEKVNPKLMPSGSRVFRLDNMTSQSGGETTGFQVEMHGRVLSSGKGYWKSNRVGIDRLMSAVRVVPSGRTLAYIRYIDDFPVYPIGNLWTDTGTGSFTDSKVYVVQTGTKVIERCLLMTTDPGDLVLDPTCGSGTTAYVAERWGRRWITCDTSRVSVTLSKQRLMTASFDYYKLAHSDEGIGSGFIYKTVPHITLKAIANNEEIDRICESKRPGIEAALRLLNEHTGNNWKEWEVPAESPLDLPRKAQEPFEQFHSLKRNRQKLIDASIERNADQETLYDQPLVDNSKVRVTGPFTVEAVPFPAVQPLDEVSADCIEADESIVRSGETLRKNEWLDELFKTGIRGKGGQKIAFSRLEPLPGTRWLHAEGETKEELPKRVVVSFGPEHAPLEQRQVALALEEAASLVPKPKIVVFASFQFDPEASKDIDETNWPGISLLKVQMNTDLLTEDLKKKRSGNESFWLIGQPEVHLQGVEEGKYQVEVIGFDYYNTKTGVVESGGTEKIAVWMLDTDYDGRSVFPRQVFFPMSDGTNGWSKLARNLNGDIDPELIDAYRGTTSIPFEPGEYKRVAVKIVDDRGIESLKIIGVE